jgi:hypothetical protein
MRIADIHCSGPAEASAAAGIEGNVERGRVGEWARERDFMPFEPRRL